MISATALGSASGAANYLVTEYYAGQDGQPALWQGAGAAEQRLTSREVTREDLSRILAGTVQERRLDGFLQEKQLGRLYQGEHQHRAGWDFTFAPSKSVSVEAEVYNKGDIAAAHQEAVTAAMGWLEREAAQTRVGGQFVQTGNLTWAGFQHHTTRAGDPQLHTHVAIANVTYHDGTAYSLSNERLLQYRTAADAIYRNELAGSLQRMGYQLDFNRRGNFEIVGYSREQLEHFSKRSGEIRDELARHGLDKDSASHAARQIATLATRQGKDHSENPVEHRERWQAEASALGIVAAERGEAREAMRNVQQIVRDGIEHLGEREQAFSAKGITLTTYGMARGEASHVQIQCELKRLESVGELIRREDGKFTTREAVNAERCMAERLSEGVGVHQAIMDRREFGTALASFEARKGFEFSSEQREAARMILTGDDRFQGVQGLAGTGKTTMLEFVRDAAESKGWQVQGFSNGAEQAAKLETESGISSSTVARFCINRASAEREPGFVEQGTAKVLYINDEASMSSQREINRVIGHTEKAGARTVFTGDHKQHQSVEAGKAYEIAQRHMPTAELGRESIRRQTTEQAIAARDAALGRRYQDVLRTETLRVQNEAQEKAKELYKDAKPEELRAAVKEAAKEDNKAVIAGLAREYASMAADKRLETLVLTSTNADRHVLNTAIREELRMLSELGNGHRLQTLEKSDATNVELRDAVTYGRGQYVRFTGNYDSLGVAKGEYGRVEGRDTTNNSVTLRMEEGRYVTFSPARIAGKELYSEAQGKEFAVGDQIVFKRNDQDLDVKNGSRGTVERFDGRAMSVRLNDGSAREIDTHHYRTLDHAYATTSYSAQGQTVDRVMIHHNTEAGRHGDRETYVNVTRARCELSFHTQNPEKAAAQLGVKLDKESAVEHARTTEREAGGGQDRLGQQHDQLRAVDRDAGLGR